MDETKIELPAWLPWATTACLAALVACLVELWMIERTRTQLLTDENLMAETSLKAAQNQLEAERIVNGREIEDLRTAPSAGGVAVLAVPGAGRSDTFGLEPAWGVAVWDAAARNAQVRIAGLPRLGADRDYQLWIEGPGLGVPAGFIVHTSTYLDSYGVAVHLAQPVAEGYRMFVVDVAKGGASTLKEAEAKGSIVLASLPSAGKISYR